MALNCYLSRLFANIFEEEISNNKGDNGRTDIIRTMERSVLFKRECLQSHLKIHFAACL